MKSPRSLLRSISSLFPIQKFTVAEQSMLPTLRPVDKVLVWKWVNPGPGEIVVARVGHLHFIKRIERIVGDKYFLLGDNPRAQGATKPTVSSSDILGRVFYVQRTDEYN